MMLRRLPPRLLHGCTDCVHGRRGPTTECSGSWSMVRGHGKQHTTSAPLRQHLHLDHQPLQALQVLLRMVCHADRRMQLRVLRCQGTPAECARGTITAGGEVTRQHGSCESEEANATQCMQQSGTEPASRLPDREAVLDGTTAVSAAGPKRHALCAEHGDLLCQLHVSVHVPACQTSIVVC